MSTAKTAPAASPKKRPARRLDRDDPRARAGRHARRKGSTFERLMAKRLLPLFPNAKRGLGQARSRGEVADIEGTPFWPELKCYESNANVRKALAQAHRDATKHGRGRIPVAIVRRSNVSPDIVAMAFEDWLDLVRDAMAWRALRAPVNLDALSALDEP